MASEERRASVSPVTLVPQPRKIGVIREALRASADELQHRFATTPNPELYPTSEARVHLSYMMALDPVMTQIAEALQAAELASLYSRSDDGGGDARAMALEELDMLRDRLTGSIVRLADLLATGVQSCLEDLPRPPNSGPPRAG